MLGSDANLCGTPEGESSFEYCLSRIRGYGLHLWDHSAAVAKQSAEIAKRFGCCSKEMSWIAAGAILHDIGKCRVPHQILAKPEALTEAEWGIMKRHALYGFQEALTYSALRQFAPIILCHHERWDGTGYLGLAGANIPWASRIIAVADATDSMLSDRPYRPGIGLKACAAELMRNAGSQFDPAVVECAMPLLILNHQI